MRPKSVSVGVSSSLASVMLLALAIGGCSEENEGTSATASTVSATSGPGATSGSSSGGASAGGSSGMGTGGATGGSGGVPDPGPNVDTSDPQLYANSFKPNEADPAAMTKLGTELAYLDTNATPKGVLVVYLHGAGDSSGGTCGSAAHSEMLAALGFHVFDPCYESAYGVDKCGNDIEGCRLEAFEGVDHTDIIDVKPPDSIETRIVMGLAFAQTKNPEGDWTYFVDGEKPRWNKIIISGVSHGASSSGVIALHRTVLRSVMLSGPYDVNQPWLDKKPMTPIGEFYGFTAVSDMQHPGHLAAFESLMMTGEPVTIEGASPPYDGSHRLVTGGPGNSHGAVQAGGSSPKDNNGDYVYQPVWETMYAAGL